MRNAPTLFRNILYRCTGGVLCASVSLFLYFCGACIYALYSTEKPHADDIGISKFIPEKQYLIPGVSITLSVGFLLGAYLTRCIDTANDGESRQTRRPIAMPAAPPPSTDNLAIAEQWIPGDRGGSDSDDESSRDHTAVV